MCTWALGIAAAGLAASVGGTLYSASQNAGYAADQNKAQQQKEALSNAARQAEYQRQKDFSEQAAANYQQQLQEQGPAKFQEAAKEGEQQALETTQQVQRESNLQQGLLPGQTGTSVSDVFTKDAGRAASEKMADANKRIAALAKLSGYDRAAGHSSIIGKRYDADTNLLGNEAKASLALGQQEGSVAAPFVGSPNSSLGAAATGLGSLGLQYGASKGAWGDIKDIFGGGPGFTGTIDDATRVFM